MIEQEANRAKFKKLVKDQWQKIEQKNFGSFEVRVHQTLEKLGSTVANELLIKPDKVEQQNATIKETCLGQDLYLTLVRVQLVKFGFVAAEAQEEDNKKQQKEKEKDKGGKKGSKNAQKNKQQEQLLNMSKDRLKEQVKNMLETMGVIITYEDIKIKEQEFLKVEQATRRIKTLEYVELKFAALVIYAEQLLKSRINSKFRDEYAFELIYFLKNLYIKYNSYEGQSYLEREKTEKVSASAVKDLRKKLVFLNKEFGFSNRVLFNKYPKLVIDTDLNQTFSQTDIKPYKAQEELMKILVNCELPTLVFLNTMVGTGKTVMSIALASYLQKIRNNITDPKSKNLLLTSDQLKRIQILYCCPLDTVRTQVGSAAYERKIKFAIASMWNDPFSKRGKEQGFYECPRIVNSFSNQSESFATLIIADFKTTLELLKEKYTEIEENKSVIRWQGKDRKYNPENYAKNGDEYILFIDEPTVDADFQNSEITQILVEIMRRAPPITILSSATLPSPNKLPNLIKFFSKKHGSHEVKQILADEFQIGCQVFSHDGRKFLPHYRAVDEKSLKGIIKRLLENPFMQRCYNANAYCELNDRMRENGVQDIEDFELFDQISQKIVQEKSIGLLHILSQQTDQIIKNVCSEIRIQPTEEELQKEQQEVQEEQAEGEEGEWEYEYVYETTDVVNDKKIKIEQDDITKFAAPYSILNLKELGGKMAHKFTGGCLITVVDPVETIRKKFRALIKNCDKAQNYIKEYEKQLELLEKEKEKKERDIDNEIERSKQIQALQEQMNVVINFPNYLKVNTLDHFKKFVSLDPYQIEQFKARKAFSLEAIKYDLEVPDDILLYLFSGIAAYTEKPSQLNQEYYEEVLKLASNGQLAFIVSDDSMCYGVNYPLNHVIVTDPMAKKRSIGALFQLIGRAGRVGVSWVANAYLDNQAFDRLVSYLEGNEANLPEMDEAFNIEKQAKDLLNKLRQQAEERKRQKEQKEQTEKQVQ